MSQIDRPRPLLWAAWVFFVVYGSLLPFEFHALPLDQALDRFIQLPFLQLGIDSRADWVANGVLYLPVGALTAHTLIAAFRGRAKLLAVSLAIAFGVTLATAVEFTQEFFPGRTVSQNDLMAETIGTVLGALLTPLLLPWVRRLDHGWHLGGAVLARRALEAYALAYLALCLFPYDLLLNADEWQAKLGSSGWGWWLASATRERGWLGLLLLGVEAVLSLPYGLLLALKSRSRRFTLLRALLLGVLLGAVIELGQLTIASGVSQGASVLSRTLGVVLGAWLGGRGWRELAMVRRSAHRHAMFWQVAHAGLVLAVSGWVGRAWRTPSQVWAQWAELNLMPFYYHYFTTEAQALFSLGSVALMYAPIALLGWACRRSIAADMALAATLALVAETGKLWLDGLHPDPSNVLIAVVTCAALRAALRRASVGPAAPALAAAAPVAGRSPGNAHASAAKVAASVIVASALTLSSAFPAAALPLTLLLAASAAAVAWRPAWALVILPAALPVLDLAPLSGRLLYDEFDLLQLALLPMLWLGTRGRVPAAPGMASLPLKAAAALLVTSWAISLVSGGWPWHWPDANSLAGLPGPYNALRIGKGLIWAAAFAALIRRLPEGPHDQQRLLATGLCLGLGLTVAVVLWERAAFVGLADFDADYRVTGPFSAMHTGGATIECFLAMAGAVAIAMLVQARRVAMKGLLLGLLLLTSYALMVTYSRNGYGALLAAMVLMALATLRQPTVSARQRLAGGVVALAMLAAAAPTLLGTFAQQRLARTAEDYAVRLAHWRDALSLRDPGTATALFGMGLGQFPELHFWRSAEPVHAGLFRLESGAAGAQLRLGAGASMYVEQVVAVGAGQRLQLTLKLRAKSASGLGLALCEKWLLTSLQCARIEPVSMAGTVASDWQEGRWTIDTQAWTVAPGWLKRPVKLALFHADSPGTVEVAQVQLRDEAGRSLLANGDFSQGLDHWFYSTDIDPPWHIHSWPVTVLFEQGWLGLLAWTAALGLAVSRTARSAWRGDLNAAGVLAALAAFGVSGLVNTLTDAPRLLWLLCLLLWLGGSFGRPPQQSPGAGGGTADPSPPSGLSGTWSPMPKSLK